jgi:hypothetical protein
LAHAEYIFHPRRTIFFPTSARIVLYKLSLRRKAESVNGARRTQSIHSNGQSLTKSTTVRGSKQQTTRTAREHTQQHPVKQVPQTLGRSTFDAVFVSGNTRQRTIEMIGRTLYRNRLHLNTKVKPLSMAHPIWRQPRYSKDNGKLIGTTDKLNVPSS